MHACVHERDPAGRQHSLGDPITYDFRQSTGEFVILERVSEHSLQ